jgi:hypothetical protein
VIQKQSQRRRRRFTQKKGAESQNLKLLVYPDAFDLPAFIRTFRENLRAACDSKTESTA